MDKIYEALRKLSTDSSKSGVSNSEYFSIGPLIVRVSDHSCGNMSCGATKMYILINPRKNLYTVCYGKAVQVCTYQEVINICKTFLLLKESFSSLFHSPVNAELDDEKRLALWNVNLGNDRFFEEQGYAISNFTKAEKKELRRAFQINALYSDRIKSLNKVYNEILSRKFSEFKSKLLTVKPSKRIELFRDIDSSNWKIQQKTYVGMLLANIESFSDLQEVIKVSNKFNK